MSLAPEHTPAAAPTQPVADTPVLTRHRLRPGADPADQSRFGDDRWILTPAMHEAHAKATSLDTTAIPAPFRAAVKLVAWLMLNHDPVETVLNGRSGRPTVRTVAAATRDISRFCEWLTQRNITTFAAVTAPDLDDYATEIRHAQIKHWQREDLLAAVSRLWSMRSLLPEQHQLPPAPPWGGDRIHDVLGQSRSGGENRTPRIHPDTMAALLSWSLRFVEDFAADIIAAFDEYKHLTIRNPRRRRTTQAGKRPRARPNELCERLTAVIERYRAAGRGLPGSRRPDGTLTVNAYHLGRLVDGQVMLGKPATPAHDEILAASGLPIDDACYLFAPITASIDGQPWRSQPITYDEAPQLARLLSVACYLVIGYLSGQRVGETLNLRRGCIEHDRTTGLIFLRGLHFKGVTDQTRTKIPEGQVREDPWVVTAPVATAVSVLERLHTSPWLFPNTLAIDGRADGPHQTRAGLGRTEPLMTLDIAHLCTWVNAYCHTTGRVDTIPPDPAHPRLHPARLRRTLAWFIARRPRGLVAAAIQYGHVSLTMTLGYSGTYASGFPDDLAFEEWLAKIETLAAAHDRLNHGEHVSGPAAATYRHRVNAATRFAGRVLRTGREAAALLANPDMQIYPGDGMTCVLDPNKAACRLTRDESGHRQTPDLDNCRPHCGNIARTDTDTDALRDRVARLQTLVADPLAPPIRAERERHELQRLTAILTEHQQGQP
jgi:integrase